MKQRNLKKKVGALLLAVAMIVPIFPAVSTEVHAAELPTDTQFATKEQLLNDFDTKNNTQKADGTQNEAKVYFGNNNQKWWIVGSQNGNLTLFAASPLETRQSFEPNYTNNKTYSADWECNYENEPAEVFPNHYGASLLRTTLQSLESSYFTSAEKTLMNDTTIYTNDTKNSSVYSTTNKLYLAYGDYDDDKYITVGTNSEGKLNNGLRIDKSYWGNSNFWLRAPYYRYSNEALVAWSGIYLYNYGVSNGYALVPAFELNLSSALFASAAPAASSNGKLTLDDTFTLRYETDTLGSAFVPYDKSKVELTNVPANTYLVVQNSEDAYAKQITNETSVSASDMGLTDFANCKVWLETTNSNERMTYATLATEEQGYSVEVVGNTELTISSQNGSQEVAPGSPITDIIVTANDGYRFPENYGSGLTLNGLTLTRVSETEIKLSGTPNADTYIQLPEVEAIPKADTPTVSVTSTTSSITLEITNYDTKFGEVQYSTDNGTNWQTANVQNKKFMIADLHSSTDMTILVKFTGMGTDYLKSDAATVNASTSQASYTISIPERAMVGGNYQQIKVDDTKTFDLGHEEKVSVKIKDTGTISNGKLILTRENDPTNKTVTSAIYINDNPFNDLTKDVALFKKGGDSVGIRFMSPVETNIAAGTYKGIVTFEVSLIK